MKRNWNPGGLTPSSAVTKVSVKGENGHQRVESSASRSRLSSFRRSRSPRRKKSLSPPPKRTSSLHGKRRLSRSRSRDRMKLVPKRRICKRSRSPLRRVSKDKVPSYSCTVTKDSVTERPGSHIGLRDERYRSADKYIVDRPFFRGPERDVKLDRDNLKKIVVNMKGSPTASDSIKREIVNPEDITLVRRAVTSRRGQYGADAGKWIKSIKSRYKIHDRYSDYEEVEQNKSEGSRPIFDRDEIKKSSRKYEQDELGTRKLYNDSPPYSGRRSSNERFRSRDSHYEGDRSARNRDPSSSRHKDYGSHSHERHREDRSRYSRRSRSHERSRDYGHERRDRYDVKDYRRSRKGGKSSARSLRRHPSPAELRRMNGRRLRSSEREAEPRHREKEHPPSSEYPASDYQVETHCFYEAETVEGPIPLIPRGGAHSIPFRGRGGAGIPMIRPGEMLMRGGPPMRSLRPVFMPRVPGIGRRFPFHPRLVRPLVRPVLRVLAPVLPVRSPPVIPMRHPVIPLPFQCDTFR